jgi:hypothetical protein
MKRLPEECGYRGHRFGAGNYHGSFFCGGMLYDHDSRGHGLSLSGPVELFHAQIEVNERRLNNGGINLKLPETQEQTRSETLVPWLTIFANRGVINTERSKTTLRGLGMSFASERGMGSSALPVLKKLFHSSTGGDGSKHLSARTWKRGAV